MDFRVEEVSLDQTSELRREVLRPHDRSDPLLDEGSQDMTSGSFAAIDDEGNVIGSARVRPVRAPTSIERLAPPGPAWQLRGMATRADVRDLGVGQAVLMAVIDYVAKHGGGLLWCNARWRAVPFYERAGFVTEGTKWEEPFIGPHIRMWRTVTAQ